jgi:hypothetical protein
MVILGLWWSKYAKEEYSQIGSDSAIVFFHSFWENGVLFSLDILSRLQESFARDPSRLPQP